MNELLRQLLIDEEGVELDAYQDSRGIWTIGIGHNLEIDQTDEELDAIGRVELPDDLSTVTITTQEAYKLFDIDVNDAIEDISSVFDVQELNDLGETRRAVILSMVFQLGGGGIRKFKNFIAAVKSQDWDTASDEMLFANVAAQRPSAWYRQTPERCQRAADAMRVGYFEKYNRPTQSATPTSDVPDIKIDLSKVSDAELIAELSRRLGVSYNGQT